MKQVVSSLLTLSVLGVPAAAQVTIPTPPRPVTNVSQYLTQTSVTDWWNWKTATTQKLLPKRGNLDATHNLVYAVYADVEGFRPGLALIKSTNGGYSWSKPSWVFQLNANEKWFTDEQGFYADGDELFVLTRMSRQDVNSGSVGIHLFYSPDQGQTWTSALVSQGFATPNPTLEHLYVPSGPKFHSGFVPGSGNSSGTVHFCYEAKFTGANVGSGEELFYGAATIQNGQISVIRSDVRITDSWATVNDKALNKYDVDGPRMVVQNQFVVITWIDDRKAPGNNTNNEIYIRHSRDGGATWQPETDVSGGTARSAETSHEAVSMAIAGIYAFVGRTETQTNVDRLNGTLLNLVTNKTVYQNQNVDRSGVDIDASKAVSRGNSMYVIIQDQRAGTNDQARWYGYMDPNFGQDLLDQTKVSELDITTSVANWAGPLLGGLKLWEGASTTETLLWNGDTIVMSGECRNSGENACAIMSNDNGKTWKGWFFSPGSRDIDEPWCAVTPNGDVVSIYIDDGGSGNANNRTYVSGFKYPMLVDRGATLDLEANGNEKDFAILVASFGTSPPWVLDVNRGLVMNVAVDPLFIATLGLFPLQLVNNGVAKFPWIPNIGKTVGQDIYAATLLFSVSGNQLQLKQFSDPVLSPK